MFDFQDGSRRFHAIHENKYTNYKQQLPGHLNHDRYKQTQVEFELKLNSIWVQVQIELNWTQFELKFKFFK